MDVFVQNKGSPPERAGGRKFENRIYGNVICVMNMGDGLPGNEGPAMWWFVMW